MGDWKERADYHGDVIYEVWRSGGNPDRVSDDCIADCYDGGREAEACAHDELHRQQQARQQQQMIQQQQEEEEEAYYRQVDEENAQRIYKEAEEEDLTELNSETPKG